MWGIIGWIIWLLIFIALWLRNREDKEYYNGRLEKKKIYINRRLSHIILYGKEWNIEAIHIDLWKNKEWKRFYFYEDWRFHCKEEDGWSCIYYDRDWRLEQEWYWSPNWNKDKERIHYHYYEDGKIDSKTIYDKWKIIEENFYGKWNEHTKYIYEDWKKIQWFKYNESEELIEEINFHDDKKTAKRSKNPKK